MLFLEMTECLSQFLIYKFESEQVEILNNKQINDNFFLIKKINYIKLLNII